MLISGKVDHLTDKKYIRDEERYFIIKKFQFTRKTIFLNLYAIIKYTIVRSTRRNRDINILEILIYLS